MQTGQGVSNATKVTILRVNLYAAAWALASGALGAALGALAYISLQSSFLASALAFASVMCFSFAGLFISERLRPRFTPHANRRVVLALMLACALAISVIAGLLAWLNGGGVRTNAPIAIMVDDSGSMETNDPGNIRAGEVIKLVDKLRNNHSVLVGSYNSGASVRGGGFMPASDMRAQLADFRSSLHSSGGTETQSALSLAFEHAAGARIQLLLITDGVGNIGSKDDWIQICADTGSSISFIQLGDETDSAVSIHEQLALETGGQLLRISDISELDMGLGAVLGVGARLLCPGEIDIWLILSYAALGLMAGAAYYTVLGAPVSARVQILVSLIMAGLGYAPSYALSLAGASMWARAFIALLPFACVITPYRYDFQARPGAV